RQRCEGLTERYAAIAQAIDLQDRRLPVLDHRRFPLVLLHGDAKAENFLTLGHRVVAVDVDYRLRGLPEMDLAQFLVQLRCLPLLSTRVVSTAERARLEAAFLDSYARLR